MARRSSSRSSSSLRRGGSFLDPQRSWPPAIERLSINEELAALAVTPNSYFYGETEDRDFPHALTFVPNKQMLAKPRPVGPVAYRASTIMAPFGQLRIFAPRRVLFCLRRKVRKEVLFALRIAGRRGVGAGKRWRRTAESSWRC